VVSFCENGIELSVSIRNGNSSVVWLSASPWSSLVVNQDWMSSLWNCLIRGYIQKFPDCVDNEINNKKHSLRSNTNAYDGKTHYTYSQNSDTTPPNGRELYHLQFSLQADSPETFGYTHVYARNISRKVNLRCEVSWSNKHKKWTRKYTDWVNLWQDFLTRTGSIFLPVCHTHTHTHTRNFRATFVHSAVLFQNHFVRYLPLEVEQHPNEQRYLLLF
jgi:hypothetical protein